MITETKRKLFRKTLSKIMLVCAIAFLARLAVYVYLIVFPIANESGNLVSPMIFQLDADYSFYFDSLEIYKGSLSEFLIRVVNSFNAPLTHLSTYTHDFVTSGPVMPLLFIIFRYSVDNTLPLSIATFMIGTITTWLWITWLHRRGIGVFWLLVFAILPNPIWYQVNNSLDTCYALFVALFVITFLSKEPNHSRVAIGIGAGSLATLAKPNGLPLIVFLFIDIFLHHLKTKYWAKLAFILTTIAIVAAFVLFYMAYLVAFFESSRHFTFYGVPYIRYFGGIYDGFPAVVDLPLSWASLIAAKLFYLVGLRPSWGMTSLDLVLIRSAPGLILLPGLLWLLIKRPHRTGLCVLLYLIPPFLGATQERYLLPIMPVVFYYGIVAYSVLLNRVRTYVEKLR